MDVYEEQDFDDCVDLQKVELVLLGCSSRDMDSAANESLIILCWSPSLASCSLSSARPRISDGAGEKKKIRVKVRNLLCQESRAESRASP